LNGVIGDLKYSLTRMQGTVRPRNRITVSTLASSPQASLETSATVRPVVTTLLIGLIVALGLPVVIDGAVRRRKVKHAVGKPAGVQGRVRLQNRARQLAESWGRSSSR
jgi:hypothetical protein